VGYEVRQIKDIDCVAQKFFADFSIIMKWYEPDLIDNPSVTDKPELDMADVPGAPPFYIANSVNVELKERDITVNPDDPPGIVTMNTSYAGELSEFMELELFPLDVQDLTISIRSKEKGWVYKLLTGPMFTRIRESVELAEWVVYSPKIVVSVGKQGRVLYELKMVVSRKPGFYVYNVMVMVGGISTLAFFSFLFRAEDWNKRSNYVGMLLLTTVAFKFITADALPKVSFMTIMDIYLFASFIVLLILIAQSAILKAIITVGVVELELGSQIDLLCAGLISLGWFFGNWAFFHRFYAIERENTADLGDPLPDVVTNHASAGAFGFVLGTEEED
jgi:hypothetical protein